MIKVALLGLLIALCSSLTYESHQDTYAVTESSVLDPSVTSKLKINMQDGWISFQGCNFLYT